MDRFVKKTGARSHVTATSQTAQSQIEAPVSALPDDTVDNPDIEVSAHTTPPSSLQNSLSPHSAPPPYLGYSNTDRIAQAVAGLLSPMITTSVEKVVDVGMRQFKAQLGEHPTRLGEVENRLSSLEEEVYQAQATEQEQDKNQPIYTPKT